MAAADSWDASYFWRGIVITLLGMLGMIVGIAIVFLFSLAARALLPIPMVKFAVLTVIGVAFGLSMIVLMLSIVTTL